MMLLLTKYFKKATKKELVSNNKASNNSLLNYRYANLFSQPVTILQDEDDKEGRI